MKTATNSIPPWKRYIAPGNVSRVYLYISCMITEDINVAKALATDESVNIFPYS